MTNFASLLRPNRVTVFDPDSVTTTASDEVDASTADLAPSAVDAIWEAVRRLYLTGLHPGMAICIRRHGRVVLHRAIGHSHGNTPAGVDEERLQLATPSTLYNLFSASKSVTAMLIHMLDERGLLHIDDRVGDYVPEYAKYGKEPTTIRHVLNHRAGIALAGVDADADLSVLLDEGELVRRLCEARPQHVPGRKLAYHALSGGFLLAEIIRRVSGLHIRDFLDREIRQPLGFDHFQYGVPASMVDRVATDVFTGPVPPFPVSMLLERAFGAPVVEAVGMAASPTFLTACVPSGNVICTANDACRFFELLLRGGTLEGKTLFDPKTIRRAVHEQSYHEYDLVLQYPFRYGLGFMLGSANTSILGPDTPAAFGHMGFTNVVVYADPERDISVSFVNSGKPVIAVDALWWINVARTIAESIPKVA